MNFGPAAILVLTGLLPGTSFAGEVRVPLPLDLGGVDLGMDVDSLLSKRPNARSHTTTLRILSKEPKLDPRFVDRRLKADRLGESLSARESPLMDTVFYEIRKGKLAGLEFLLRNLPREPDKFARARANQISVCYGLWGREGSRRVGQIGTYKSELMALFEWKKGDVRILLRLPVILGMPGSLAILTPDVAPRPYPDASMSDEDVRRLFESMELDKIWKGVTSKGKDPEEKERTKK